MQLAKGWSHAPGERHVRRKRQELRADASEARLQRWDAAETWYFNRLRPTEQFDVVIEASGRRERHSVGCERPTDGRSIVSPVNPVRIVRVALHRSPYRASDNCSAREPVRASDTAGTPAISTDVGPRFGSPCAALAVCRRGGASASTRLAPNARMGALAGASVRVQDRLRFVIEPALEDTLAELSAARCETHRAGRGGALRSPDPTVRAEA